MKGDTIQPAGYTTRYETEGNKDQGSRQYDDEIDLLALVAIIYQTLQKRLWAILIVWAMALIAGNVKYFTEPPLFRGNLIAQSDLIESTEVKYLTAALNEELHRKGRTEFASLLGLPEHLAGQVVGINLKEINSLEGAPGIIFKLEVEANGAEGAAQIGEGLLRFYEAHPFVQKKLTAKTKVEQELIGIFDLEKEDIEESKGAVQSMLETAGTESAYTLFINHLKGLSLQKLALDEKTVKLKNELENRRSVMLIQNLGIPRSPFNKNYPATIGMFMLGGLVFSLALVFTYELFLKIKQYPGKLAR